MTGLSDEAIGRLCAVANWPEFETARYTVSNELGRGGMGTVYAAVDDALGREVALKVSNTVASAAFERRLAAEARVLARLEHPGIVPVHDVGRLADGRLFYVMKRVHGTTLSDYLKRPTSLGERLRIFERICEAVAFAHANRILHRDLKPDNVMVGSFGEVMVMDWGVAKALAPEEAVVASATDRGTTAGQSGQVTATTSTGAVLGTRGFMAPEQERGTVSELDERADVYALGALLLALLTTNATPLGHGAAPSDALAGLTAIPRPLRSICARAMGESPADRYPSAAALGDDVSRFRAGQAVQAHRETTVERATRLATVYRTPILLVLAYMVMRALVAFATGR
jgi:serine/threonine protein kinase